MVKTNKSVSVDVQRGGVISELVLLEGGYKNLINTIGVKFNDKLTNTVAWQEDYEVNGFEILTADDSVVIISSVTMPEYESLGLPPSKEVIQKVTVRELEPFVRLQYEFNVMREYFD